MKTIEISDELYEDLLYLREGNEEINKTLERELMDSRVKAITKRVNKELDEVVKNSKYSP
ncbi:hypothetical protein [Methanolacinia paynteri]|uniref:hypothetical protein n=1 Tax=Methanolacinia paynteri TaxID=230356 RepID=UPI0012F65712|nr:hypothetical protein [Methanolacinia paynteri]